MTLYRTHWSASNITCNFDDPLPFNGQASNVTCNFDDPLPVNGQASNITCICDDPLPGNGHVWEKGHCIQKR